MVNATEKLAQQIESIRRQLVLSRTPQLPNASIDNGALTLVTDGQVTGYVGQQYDGTTGAVIVAGPIPPIPTAPTVETAIGGIRVTGLGTFLDPQTGYTSPVVAPMDFLRYDIEVSEDPAFPNVGFGPVHGSISSAAGGRVTISWPNSGATVYVRLRTITTAGKRSDPSGTTSGSTGLVQFGDLGFSISDYGGGSTIYYGPSSPSAPILGFEAGDMWLQTTGGSGGSGQPLYLTYRWNGSSWALLQDQGISQSLADALAAQTTADSKVKVFVQPTQPTASEVGDVWYDSDDGNAQYVWGPVPTITRQNYAKNPSFEYDAAGTLTPTGWTLSSAGTTGTVTASVVASGATYGTKVGKIVGATLSTLNTSWVGFQQTITALPADILQLQAFNVGFGVASASQRPEWMVEWLNASNAVISTLTDTSAAAITVGTRTSYGYTTTAAPALTTQARITLRRRGTLSSGGSNVTNADMSVDAMLFERNRPSNSQTDYFDGGYPTTTESIWDTPATAPNSTSTYWEPGTSGANAWQKQMIRSGAIQPKSLVASNIIATGTITAALLEVNMVLATTVNAGPLASDHSSMAPDGFHVYRTLAGEGLVEVGRLGGGSANGFLGFVDSTGKLVANIDETGHATFAGGLNVSNGISIDGKSVITSINESYQPVGTYRVVLSPNQGGNSYGFFGKSGVANPVGIVEVNGFLTAGNRYQIFWQLVWTTDVTSGADNDEMLFGIAIGTPTSSGSDSASAPLASGGLYEQWLTTNPRGGGARWITSSGSTKYTATTTGRHRFLLTGQAGSTNGGNTVVIADSRFPVSMDIVNLGPAKPDTGQISQGGVAFVGGGSPGTPPTPTQQYDTGQMAPAGHRTFMGNGTERFDTTDVVQGYDPSGFNGDGGGFWWWSIPSITGTVDVLQLYIFYNHWYYNSGGTALISMIPNGVGSNYTTSKFGTLNYGGWPNPGGLWLDLGGSLGVDWRSNFRNVGAFGFPQAVGFSIGPSGGSNLTYYGRADGPGARLRIIYTQ